jgi:phosphoribosylcarboxyaminoimidazole (NCAIR) mutase
MAINNNTSAALLAVRILGAQNQQVLSVSQDYLIHLEHEHLGIVEKLEEYDRDSFLSKK